MVNVNNVYVQYGDRKVLDRISTTIQEKERLGLTGRNGAGKSTLLKIIAGQITPTEGNISYPSNITIGFLHQDMFLPKGKTVLEEAMSAFDEVLAAEKRLQEVESELSERTDYESDEYMQLINELTELSDKLSMIGGDTMRVETEKILMGLGFKVTDFSRQTTEFSGGWQMRIELAKMLLKRPKLLLLDEPTNHLDIESIIWLEQFLLPYEGAVIVISHDKTFLDNVTKRTIEIELGKLHDYKANYSKYLELRAERQAQLQSSYESQQKEIARKEMLIDKFKAKASKAKMAQSLVKELDRMEKIEMETTDSSRMRFEFPPSPRSGEVVVDVKQMTKGYDQKIILDKIDFQVIRGERIAFMGKNGEGKSTLIKLITGDITPTDGVVQLGHNVHMGYYAQNQAEALDPKITVLETMEKHSPFELRPRLRNMLGSFLFRGEDVDKKVSVLSGGERARLAMAVMLLHPINLLVMDEPTNHLDMLSKAILKRALLEYDGTLIVVSHDRDFLDAMTDKVIEFTQKKLVTYIGDLQYFLEKRQFGNLREVSLGKNNLLQEPKVNQKTEKSSGEDAEKIKFLKKNMQQAEKKIQKIESEMKECESKMADNTIIGTPQYQMILDSYHKLKNDLDLSMEEWENLVEELDKSEAK
jgi:ATP-binding cassette subfamily F protein 3